MIQQCRQRIGLPGPDRFGQNKSRGHIGVFVVFDHRAAQQYDAPRQMGAAAGPARQNNNLAAVQQPRGQTVQRITRIGCHAGLAGHAFHIRQQKLADLGTFDRGHHGDGIAFQGVRQPEHRSRQQGRKNTSSEQKTQLARTWPPAVNRAQQPVDTGNHLIL